MFRKRYEFLVDEKDVLAMNKLLQDLGYKYRSGNCGWALAPTCWFYFVNLKNKEYVTLLQNLAKSNIKLLPPTTGYEES